MSRFSLIFELDGSWVDDHRKQSKFCQGFPVGRRAAELVSGAKNPYGTGGSSNHSTGDTAQRPGTKPAALSCHGNPLTFDLRGFLNNEICDGCPL